MVEAMAFGLPVVTTRWRSIPEMLPPDYPGLVATRIAGTDRQRAAALVACAMWPGRCANYFSRRFTLEQHLAEPGRRHPQRGN